MTVTGSSHDHHMTVTCSLQYCHLLVTWLSVAHACHLHTQSHLLLKTRVVSNIYHTCSCTCDLLMTKVIAPYIYCTYIPSAPYTIHVYIHTQCSIYYTCVRTYPVLHILYMCTYIPSAQYTIHAYVHTQCSIYCICVRTYPVLHILYMRTYIPSAPYTVHAYVHTQCCRFL